MVRLQEIQRTAVFAWSPGAGTPLLATGTRAGAVSEDFSTEVKLELWHFDLDTTTNDRDLTPLCSVTADSGFNDIAWSASDDDHPLGVIAGAHEDGSVWLWDAQKLKDGSSDAFLSKTTKHSGSAKALQWNPFRHNLLASVGAKGEIFIYELSNMANPFRLGATVARADDIECLDWNKQEKTAHILATGSSGGFVTIWDVKQKRDILTLNNQGRKAVSAVAWDPEESTKLATATPHDQEPFILLWSLRNSSAPERILKGHELGVLGLSWCLQDPDLLLSCGKDNRTICWNPKTGERYSDFAAGSNWAFQTGWSPSHPNMIASASFDGKILIASIQSTNVKSEAQVAANMNLDSEDFFAKAQKEPQDIHFSIPKAPKWSSRPASVSFGFGGRLARVIRDTSKKSKVTIDKFAVEDSIGEVAQAFRTNLQNGDMDTICAAKVESAKTDEEKADWQIITTLGAGKSRKQLLHYLGFSKQTDGPSANGTSGDDVDRAQVSGLESQANGANDDAFDSHEDEDNFLADLAATKGVKTNKPFQIYTGSESEADKTITKALMLGDFEGALDACLEEDRMSDAFMIAICGGQKCTDKVQAAYLKKQSDGPNYLRLLGSIVDRNLWDVVHNADLSDWKEVMAALCTYADEDEFSDLCEAFGDRLEEAYQTSNDSKTLRRDASFCYLAGAKLEKVVTNWIEELQEQEKASLGKSEIDNDFAVHAKCLQDFVEKVSVFRKVTNFQDSELQNTADWKLAPLYSLYVEYAEILAAQGQLVDAQNYLELLPAKYSGAEAALGRIKQALGKTSATPQARTAATQRAPARPTPSMQTFQPAQPLNHSTAQVQPIASSQPYAPPMPIAAAQTGTNTYRPTGYQPPQMGMPAGPMLGSPMQPPAQQAALPPPPRVGTSSPAVAPPSASRNMTNWNDMPEGFLSQRQPNSRRGTPGPQPVASPFPNAAPSAMGSPPQSLPHGQYQTQRPVAPLPPPPRAGETPPAPPPPSTAAPYTLQRPPSSTANTYSPSMPSQTVGSTLPPPAPLGGPVPRGASPYQPPPSTSSAAPSNRYAPIAGSQQTQLPGAIPQQRQVAPNPYQMQQQTTSGPQPTPPPNPYGQPVQLGSGPPRGGPPPNGPPSSAAQGPPPRKGPPQATQQPQQQSGQPEPPAAETVSPPRAKYPRGDRSHIPLNAQPIVDLLTPEISRIKSVAPQAFKPQVEDMDKRISILFDHLNNEDLLRPDTVQQMVEISQLVQRREWDQAQSLFAEMQKTKLETEGTHWMTGVKRLIAIGRATKN